MSQLWVFLAWYSLGLSLALAAGLGRRPMLACSVAFLLGLSLWIALVALWLGIGLPYHRTSALLLWLVPLVGALAVAVRRRAGRGRGDGHPGRRLLLGSAAAVMAMSAACLIDVANFTYDSHKMLALARGVGYRGALDVGLWDQLSAWGPCLILVHSTASFLPVSLLYSLAMVVWMALVATFACGLWHGTGRAAQRSSGRAVVIVTLALASCPQFAHAATYVHNNLVAAALLFVFALFFWLADRDDEPGLLIPAFVALVGLSLTRIETPFVAAVFVLVATARSQLPGRAVALGVLGFAAVVIAWLALLGARLPADGVYLTAGKAAVWIAVLVATAGYVALWHASAAARRLGRHVPVVGVGLAVAAVILTFALEPGHMVRSIGALASNLIDMWWGAAWIGAAVVAVIMVRRPAPRRAAIWRHGSLLFVAVVVLLGFVREPYRDSFWDSGNRMMLHVLPLVYFHLGLVLIPALRGAAELDTPGHGPSGETPPISTAGGG